MLQPRKGADFWLTVLGNFIDVSVLEWSKLFGDENGKHHWKRMAPDEACFRGDLLRSVGITQEQWQHAWESIKRYRDEFVAHLDSAHTMHVYMDIPYRMVHYYYAQLRAYCSSRDVLDGKPVDLSLYYQQCVEDTVGRVSDSVTRQSRKAGHDPPYDNAGEGTRSGGGSDSGATRRATRFRRGMSSANRRSPPAARSQSRTWLCSGAFIPRN